MHGPCVILRCLGVLLRLFALSLQAYRRGACRTNSPLGCAHLPAHGTRVAHVALCVAIVHHLGIDAECARTRTSTCGGLAFALQACRLWLTGLVGCAVGCVDSLSSEEALYLWNTDGM
jgi:hypothetical protein